MGVEVKVVVEVLVVLGRSKSAGVLEQESGWLQTR